MPCRSLTNEGLKSQETARVGDFFEQHLPPTLNVEFFHNWCGYNAIVARILVRHNGFIGVFGLLLPKTQKTNDALFKMDDVNVIEQKAIIYS